MFGPSIAWAADGKSLFVSSVPSEKNKHRDGLEEKEVPRTTTRYDVATMKESDVKLPLGHEVQDVSPDGKTLLTRLKVVYAEEVGYSTFLVPLDTLKAKPLGETNDGFTHARFSPTGGRVVGTRVARTKSKELGLFVADPATGKIDAVPMSKEMVNGLSGFLDECHPVGWAPDGKRLAVLWEAAAPGAPGLPGGGGGPGGGGAVGKRLSVIDADGKNEKLIRKFKPGESVLHVEWADPKLADPEK